MAVNTVQNTGYVQFVNQENGEVYSIPAEELNTSVFSNEKTFYDPGDKFNVDRTCTDGNDDGKISFGQAVKSIFKGVSNLVTAPITEAFKGNFLPLIGTAVVGGAIAVIGAPAAVAAGAIGLCVGGANLVSGICKAVDASNGGTDAEAKAAFEQIGAGGFTLLASTSGVKSGLKSMKTSDTTNLGKYYDSKGKLNELGKEASFAEKTGAYFKDLSASTKDAFTKVNPFHGKSNKPETVQEDGINEEQLIKDIMDNTDEPTALTQERLERINAIDADDALTQMQDAAQ